MGIIQRVRSLRGNSDGEVSDSDAINLVARLLSAGGISFTLDHYTIGVDGERKMMFKACGERYENLLEIIRHEVAGVK